MRGILYSFTVLKQVAFSSVSLQGKKFVDHQIYVSILIHSHVTVFPVEDTNALHDPWPPLPSIHCE